MALSGSLRMIGCTVGDQRVSLPTIWSESELALDNCIPVIVRS